VSGTSADILWTRGLGTCFGVAVTFNHQYTGYIDKVLSHLSPNGGQTQMYDLFFAVESAWRLRGYPANKYYISLPDINSQVQDMVESGLILQSQAVAFRTNLTKVQAPIVAAIRRIAQQTSGVVKTPRRRVPGMLPSSHGELTIYEDRSVYHEGQYWE
jgi:hypothetical protein